MKRIFIALLACAVAWSVRCGLADDWPQWRGPERNGVWRETGLLKEFPSTGLKILWRAEISAGYSGPTVAGGRVYVTDRVQTAGEQERVLCFDATTGSNVWVHGYECRYAGVGYPDGPRASVTIDDGRAYALGTTGHLRCLDAATGKLLWKKTPDVDYQIARPIWGLASAPLVEGELVVVQLGAKPDACIVGLDRRTGAEQWRALSDRASYAAPIVIVQAGKRVLVCWTGDRLAGLDPLSGAVYWSHPTPPKQMVINVPTPVVDGDRLFLACFYDGSYMFKLGRDTLTADLAWRRIGRSERETDALHCMFSTPLMRGGYVYGVDSYGQLRCLNAGNGDRVWEDATAVPGARWASIHMVENGQQVWMFNEQGELLIGRLSPQGFAAISRAKLIEPTQGQLSRSGKGVCWSHPAFALQRVYARNDKELVCADLREGSVK